MQYLKLFLLGCTGHRDCLFYLITKLIEGWRNHVLFYTWTRKQRTANSSPLLFQYPQPQSLLFWGPLSQCLVLTWLKRAIFFYYYFDLFILSLSGSNIFSDILLLPEHFGDHRPHFLPGSIQTLLCWSICVIHNGIYCGRLGISVVIS